MGKWRVCGRNVERDWGRVWRSEVKEESARSMDIFLKCTRFWTVCGKWILCKKE